MTAPVGPRPCTWRPVTSTARASKGAAGLISSAGFASSVFATPTPGAGTIDSTDCAVPSRAEGAIRTLVGGSLGFGASAAGVSCFAGSACFDPGTDDTSFEASSLTRICIWLPVSSSRYGSGCPRSKTRRTTGTGCSRYWVVRIFRIGDPAGRLTGWGIACRARGRSITRRGGSGSANDS